MPFIHNAVREQFSALSQRHNNKPVALAKTLGEHNICVWNGHFYALGLVRQLGIEESGGVIRIGFMHYNTKQEIDQLFGILSSL